MKYSILYLFFFVLIMSCSTKNSQSTSKAAIDLMVGTYTGNGSEGIYQLKFNPKSGELGEPVLIAKTSNPSFLDISSDGQYVYSVSEDEEGSISAWSWNDQGTLDLINEVSTYGKHPCYIDEANGLVSVANYSSGNGGIYTVTHNGGLSKGGSEFQHYGSSKNAERQGEPHAHFSQFSKDGNTLYVIDLGIDQVIGYPVNNGRLGAAKTALVAEGGDGPRHLVFHPEKNLVFIVTELTSKVISASVDQESGKFTVVDKKSTLPEDYTGESYCADIHLSADGQFLYVSNRGHQSIAIFKINEDGTLEMLGTEDVQGDWPRNFTLSPEGDFLLVANQNSDDITVFKRDKKTGLLEYTGNEIKLSHPVCLKFF